MLTLLVGNTALASDSKIIAELKTSANALDKLYQEKKPVLVVKDGETATKIKQKGPPAAAFAPVLKNALGITEQEILKALQNHQHTLSEVVFSAKIAAAKKTSFSSVLEKYKGEAWIPALREAGIDLEQTKKVLDDLYVELAFVSLAQREKGK